MSQFPIIDILPTAIPGPSGLPGAVRTGTVKLNSGQGTAIDPLMTTSSRYLACSTDDSTVGALRVISDLPNKRITIKSSQSTDSGFVFWEGKEVAT
jgi:hypothetical protein